MARMFQFSVHELPVRVQGGLSGAEAQPVRHTGENVKQHVGLGLVSRDGLLFKLQFPRPCEVRVM